MQFYPQHEGKIEQTQPQQAFWIIGRARQAHQASAYLWFCTMKWPGITLLSPGWDASPSQGYPHHEIHRYPFIHLGGERHWE